MLCASSGELNCACITQESILYDVYFSCIFMTSDHCFCSRLWQRTDVKVVIGESKDVHSPREPHHRSSPHLI